MKNKNIPQIKKDLKFFLMSEEGKIVEKDAVKLGIILFAAAGILSGVMKATDVNAAVDCDQNCCHESHGSHASHSNDGGGCSWGTW